MLAVAAVAVGAAGIVLAAQDRGAEGEADDAGSQGVAAVIVAAIAVVIVAAPFALALGFSALLTDPAAIVAVAARPLIAGATVGIGLGQGGRGGQGRSGEGAGGHQGGDGSVKGRVHGGVLRRVRRRKRGRGEKAPLARPPIRRPRTCSEGEGTPDRPRSNCR